MPGWEPRSSPPNQRNVLRPDLSRNFPTADDTRRENEDHAQSRLRYKANFRTEESEAREISARRNYPRRSRHPRRSYEPAWAAGSAPARTGAPPLGRFQDLP